MMAKNDLREIGGESAGLGMLKTAPPESLSANAEASALQARAARRCGQ